ncbi:MAG: hypothetical protein ACK4N5_21735 [Myxococcales bacterium]
MRFEDIDLAALTDRIRRALPEGEPIGYLRGKATLRDLVVRLLDCSALEAEELVDTLELRGYLHFQEDPTRRSVAEAHWNINPEAEL